MSEHHTSKRGRMIAFCVSLVGLLALAFAACVDSRDAQSPTSGVHPIDWAHDNTSDFHGTWLADNGYPLNECQACHGADYSGGDVGSSCSSVGCHEQEDGVKFCGTCHGSEDGPVPISASHKRHAPDDSACDDCHSIPTALDAEGHLNGTVDVDFLGLALANGSSPQWDEESATCANAYCHGPTSPKWDVDENLSCSGCHKAPPATHLRYQRVASGDESCASCHPTADGVLHLNGQVDTTDNMACDTCHGSPGFSAPPIALDGSATASSPGVGAHSRHLDTDLDDRIGAAVLCQRCHQIPASTTSAGHLDEAAPADVALALGGIYDSTTQSCTVWCHWDAEPGPTWTDDSGAALACEACHAFPPVLTRIGTGHPVVLNPSLDQCLDCHPFDAVNHVNGVVDFAF